MEMMRAGIWETRPSPMESRVNFCRDSASVMPIWKTPMAKPPSTLTRVMRMPATASPRTNLEAPSIAP